MATDKTIAAVAAFADALRADVYHLRLVNFETRAAIAVAYPAAVLTKPETIAYLRRENKLGFNIYIRPAGLQYVLLDDLTRPQLHHIKADDLRPCLLLETSPNNYQAWLILPDCPADREEAKVACRTLADRYGADLSSAEPDHVGRLPGYTNRKPRYRQPNGYYPFVLVRGAEHRLSTLFTPVGGWVLTNTVPDTPATPSRPRHYPVSSGQLPDRQRGTVKSESERDLGIAIGLVKKGWDDARIEAHLLAHSPDLARRKGRHLAQYIARTIQKVRSLTLNQGAFKP
jgi:hypothetical protein